MNNRSSRLFSPQFTGLLPVALVSGMLSAAAFAAPPPPPLFTPAVVVSAAQQTMAVCQITNLDPKESLAVNIQMVDADGTVLVPLTNVVLAPFQTDFSSVRFAPAAGQVNHPRCTFLPVPPGGAKPSLPDAAASAGAPPPEGPESPEGKPRPRERFRAGLQVLGNGGESLLVYLGTQ